MPNFLKARAVTAVAAAALLAAGIGSASAQVVVSSKIDNEGRRVGVRSSSRRSRNAGIETQNRLQLGGTPIVREAITAGEIDLYPEYTGNAAFFFNEADSEVWKDFDAGLSRAPPSSTARPTTSSGSSRRRPTTPGPSRCAPTSPRRTGSRR